MMLTIEKDDVGTVTISRYPFESVFTYRSGDKRGHGKTPLFMAGMKCLPLCNVPLLSANEERK